MNNASTVEQVMTSNPRTVTSDQTAEEAAREMRDRDCGSVIVTDQDGHIRGILTDRDIVVRAVAQGVNPANCLVSEICSEELEVLSPQDSIDSAVRKMSVKALKRLPVLDGDDPVGIVSLSDLAIERDPDSALGAISSASPNR